MVAEVTDAELLATGVPAINRRLNIWGLNEVEEAAYIRSGLEHIVPYIPQHVRLVLLDGADGLSDEERDKHAARTLAEAVAFAVSKTPAYLRPFAAGLISPSLSPFVNRIYEFAQVGFAFGIERETL